MQNNPACTAKKAMPIKIFVFPSAQRARRMLSLTGPTQLDPESFHISGKRNDSKSL